MAGGSFGRLAAAHRTAFTHCHGTVVRTQQFLSDQHGHIVPYTSLSRMLRVLNLREPKIRRSGTFSYPPGKEAQHDTSPHRVCIEQKTVKAQCASMVLGKLAGHSPQMDNYVAKISAFSRQGATRNLQRLLALKRNYPRQAFDQAI